MHNRSKKVWLAFVLIAAGACVSYAAPAGQGLNPPEPNTLFKTTFIRAAPGKLLELIALYKTKLMVDEAAGDARPFWWRHTQGDQWDLMILAPMGSYEDYYSKERISRRRKAQDEAPLAQKELQSKLNTCIAWKEDVFVYGPPLDMVKKAFEGMAYFHIEIMVSLPGKQAELFKERQMENAYGMALGRPENMIFVRDQGASWDIYTLGCYRDLKHWAESPVVTKEKREEAARQAGFKSPEEIGPYMRSLIDMHRDTMGVAIK